MHIYICFDPKTIPETNIIIWWRLCRKQHNCLYSSHSINLFIIYPFTSHSLSFSVCQSVCWLVSLSLSLSLSLSIYLSIYIRGSLNNFPDFVWALLLIVHTWKSSPLRSNLLLLKCTCCTVPATSWRPHGRPLVWACQWPSSQPLSSPQLSHNDSLWA